MPGAAVITDSVACLTPEQISQYGLITVPILIYHQGSLYRDGVDLSPSEALKLLDENPSQFHTSPASPAEWMETFRRALRNHSEILVVTMSSAISTTYNVANLAAEQFKGERPGAAITVIDSRSVASGQALLAIAAAERFERGESLAQVVGAIEKLKRDVSVWFALETIAYVYRTGRVPKIAAQVGGVLGVKPVLHIVDGAVHFSGVCRDRHHAFEELISRMEAQVGRAQVRVGIVHADAEQEGRSLERLVLNRFNCSGVFLSEVSPVISYATGRGTVGLAYYLDD